MYAELHPFIRPQRLAGATTTLTVIALLALAIFWPAQIPAEPHPDIIEFATIVPDTTPDIPQPVAQPAPKIDLPTPVVALKLPEFEKPMETPTLPALAVTPSPTAVARPSGADAPSGKKDGTGRMAGSELKPPVRRAGMDDSFPMSTRKDVGLVTSLNFCVTDKGRVRDVQLAVTSGFSDMDETAIRWLERERFRPGTLDGVATTMCATYDIRWVYSKATRAEAQAAAEAHAAVARERSRYPRQFVPWPYDRPFPGCDAVDICRVSVE